MNWNDVGRSAVVLIGGGGLFELFLFYGFILLRLEKVFKLLPAIVLTAVVYVLWHTGTQLTLEADPWLGALELLGVGIMYQGVFSLTYNLLKRWLCVRVAPGEHKPGFSVGLGGFFNLLYCLSV